MRPERTLPRRRFLRGTGMLGLAAAAAPLLQACAHEANQLLFLNWQDYIAPDTLTQFRTQTGVTVAYQTYASNDDLQRLLLLAGAPRRRGREINSYDLVVPSDNFVRRFLRLDLLQKLDQSKVTDIGNLRPEFRHEGFDPGNVYTVPWATGTTGIGYDSTVVTTPPD